MLTQNALNKQYFTTSKINMRIIRIFSFLLLVALLTNCNNDDDVERTPSFIRVAQISVSNIPSSDSNGNEWEGFFAGQPEWKAILFLDDADLECDALTDNNDEHLITNGTGDEHGISDFSLSINHNVPIADFERTRLGIKLIEDDGGNAFEWLSCEIFEREFYSNQDDSFTLSYSESNGVTVDVIFEKVF